MLIDIIFVIAMIMAIFKGLSKGLIVAIFSIVAYIIGLAAALKLSVVVAGWLENSTSISGKWLPLIAFALVFIGVILLVRLGAALIEKSFQAAMLGWLNRIGGAVFYIILYTIILSIFLFYLAEMGVIKPATIEASVSYSYIQPWGPKVIDNLGNIIPVFDDMFKDLQDFFQGLVTRD